MVFVFGRLKHRRARNWYYGGGVNELQNDGLMDEFFSGFFQVRGIYNIMEIYGALPADANAVSCDCASLTQM